MVFNRKFNLLAFALLLNGCSVGPDYKGAPNVEMPASWPSSSGKQQVLPTLPWWEGFNDLQLNQLITRAIAENLDLQQAQSKLLQARLMVEQASASGKPQLTAKGSALASRQYSQSNYYPRNNYGSTGFDSSWEIDLFGKIRRGVEGAQANVGAVEANRDDAKLSLLGDVAKNYFEVRGLQQRIRVAISAVKNNQQNRELSATRFKIGDGTKLEVLQAEATLAGVQATIPALQTQLELAEHALALLCAQEPSALDASLAEPAPIPTAPRPNEGVPADLIRRRPDVRAAERTLAKTIADIGVAEANRYPSLSISGSINISGSSIAGALASPIFALGPTLSLPIFDGGQRRAEVDIREQAAEQARLEYKSAVLKALKDVRDAISRLDGEYKHKIALAQQAKTAQKQVEVSRLLYKSGSGTFFEIIDAQRTLDNTRDEYVQSEQEEALATVALYKALGGGWQVTQ